MSHKPCPKCGIYLPFHHPTCSARGTAPTKSLGESLAAVGLSLLGDDYAPQTLPGRAPYEVTQRSRFDEEGEE